jgi:integrase
MKRRSRGEGSLYFLKSKGLWVSKITLPDGSRKVKYGKLQKDVREHHQTAINALRQGLMPKDDTLTVSQFSAAYMDAARHTLRPKTIEGYSSLLKTHIIPSLGKIKLSQLRPDHLQTLYTQKLESGLSRRTVHFIHSIIHKFLDQALKWGLVVRNVADLVDAPTPKRRQLTVWNREEVSKFLEFTKINDPRFYPAFVLLVYGGFREGEVLGIHRSDINLERGTITVNHAVQYLLGKGVNITEPKTERSRRSVKLPLSAFNVLKVYLEGLKENQKLLFTTDSGKPINPRFLIKHFKEDLRGAELPEIRLHDLRRTSATLLLSANVHPKVVQERLGHSSITLTLDTYSSVLPDIQDEAADKLERYIHP